jgi:hypothetical protein
MRYFWILFCFIYLYRVIFVFTRYFTTVKIIQLIYLKTSWDHFKFTHCWLLLFAAAIFLSRVAALPFTCELINIKMWADSWPTVHVMERSERPRRQISRGILIYCVCWVLCINVKGNYRDYSLPCISEKSWI